MRPMRSDTDLVEEVANWRADHASERLRRLRRADAASEEQVCARHPDLVGAPAQDRFFELEQSGRLERIEVRALRGHLRDRHFATVRDFARRELASALGAPIDFDSNPYSPPALMARAIETANPSRDRPWAWHSNPFFSDSRRRLREFGKVTKRRRTRRPG